MATSDMVDRIKRRSTAPSRMKLFEYLEESRKKPEVYATAAQRLKKAFGDPVVVDSSKDTRLKRIFLNRKFKTFPEFGDFFGIEDALESIYETITAASQGLEESKQVVYLLGPVGSAKSSIADRLKELMEREPFYVLSYKDKKGDFHESPMFESPLGIFPKSETAEIEREFKINPRHLTGICSPWASKRLSHELEGDIGEFWVSKMYPSIVDRRGIALVAPSDDNNQDVSDLIGKIDVRKLEEFASNDPDAYSYSGGLCRASQGILDFMEMFKAPLKTLNPLLSATQEKRFAGNENVGMMPFNGIILAHSNESEWDAFRSNKKNEAFLDRIKIIKVKYNLRVTEEQKIYQKDIDRSDLKGLPIAPHTLEFLARTVVPSRYKKPAKTTTSQKAQIYDGRDVRDEHANAPTLYELREEAGLDEGMEGISTRVAFKILSRSANVGDELALDPIELYNVMEHELRKEYGEERAKPYINLAKEEMKIWLYPEINQLMHENAMEDFQAYGQDYFERYVQLAKIITDEDASGCPDPDTGQMMNRKEIERRLSTLEKNAEIANTKEFRRDVVMWVMRHKDETGKFPHWQGFRKMEVIIRKIIRDETEKLLPKISFGGKKSDSDIEEKREKFLERMVKCGYTELQVKRIVNWSNNFNAAS